MTSPYLEQPLRSEAEARAMTDQPVQPPPEPWMFHDMEFATVVTVKKPGRFIALCDGTSFTREENLAHAESIIADHGAAAERDRLKVANEGLVKALEGVPLSQESCWGHSEARHYCPDCGEYGETPLAIRHNDDCCVPAIRAALDEATK